MVRLYARVAGVLLVLLGVAGLFASGQPLLGVFNVDPWENLAHLISGALMAYVGFVREDEVLAGVVVLPLSVAYTLVGVVGFVVPDLFGLLPGGLSLADDLLHLTLGVLGIGSVESSRRGDGRKGGAP